MPVIFRNHCFLRNRQRRSGSAIRVGWAVLAALVVMAPMPALAVARDAAEAGRADEADASSAEGTWNRSALAELSPEQAGELIFRELDRREAGYVDLSVRLAMVLRTANGQESRRSLRIMQLEQEHDGDKLLVVFETPKPIRGTALLSYSHRQKPDDQWLYLPALKRVKKIASHNRSGPFLSSEFAFEDLALKEVEKFDYRFLGTEQHAQGERLKVERVPRDEYSGYSQQVVWLDAQELRIERIDYYDRRGRLLKTLTAHGYVKHQDRYWKSARMDMENHQTGKSTALHWHDYQFATGLSDERDFSTNGLRRSR